MRKSTVQKGKGTVEEAAGRATGDTRLEAEGRADRAAAEARAAIERVHQSARRARDGMRSHDS
ncbi:general stress protein CsbD [Streptomyces sp. CB02009]|uniref:CsbD family protein n=1 Tax=Streptomyces sp. CB02009 TaxID=1703938 RepID=UPI00093C73B5|nr:CsbD family protein [Streptomyces sp. CB02009]OKJ63199.1 general stress protein CsbD [Streptomyces sp. CB02009]